MYKGVHKDIRRRRRTQTRTTPKRRYQAGGVPVAGTGSVADLVQGRSFRAGIENLGMDIAGKGQELLGDLKSGKIGLGNVAALAGAGAEKLISKGSATANDPFRTDKKQRAGAAVGGAVKGAGKGFDIGNKIIPGLGGAIGAGIGAIGGAFTSRKKQEKERKAAVRSMREKQNATMRASQYDGPDPFSVSAGAGFNTATSQTKSYDKSSRAKYGGARKFGKGGPGGDGKGSMLEVKPKVGKPDKKTGSGKVGVGIKGNIPVGKKVTLTPSLGIGGGKGVSPGLGVKFKFKDGGTKLPGGKSVPLPGGAVEFVGNKHSQGGIMLDPHTEVEGGETMDKVNMKKRGGKPSDYIFSEHLKLGGVSFAKRHKDILARGGSQQEIQELAKMQEKKAGRTDKVMRDGGVRKYQNGSAVTGSTNDLLAGLAKGEFTDEMSGSDKLEELNRAATAERNQGRTREDVENARLEKERIDAENAAKRAIREEKGAVQEKGTEGKYKDKVIYGGNQEDNIGNWLQMMESDMQKLPEKHRDFDFSKYKDKDGNFDVKKFNTKEGKNEFRSWYNSLPNDLVSGKIAADNDVSDLVFGDQWNSRRLLERPPSPEELEYQEVKFDIEIPDPVTDDPGEQPTDSGGQKVRKKRDVPLGPILAGAASLIPPAYALLKKPPHVPGYAPQAYAKPQLPRVNYNAQRASNASDMRATMASIENNAGGPGGMVNMIAAMSKKRQGDLQIAQAESDANKQLSAEEARLGAQTSQFNIGQDAEAQQFNRRLAREQIKDRREEVLGALDAAADRLAGITGDVLDYRATERHADAISGETGVLTREELRRQNPDLSNEEILALEAQMAEQQQIKNKEKGIKAEKKKAKKDKRKNKGKDPVAVDQSEEEPKELSQRQKNRQRIKEARQGTTTARRGGYIRGRRKIRRR